MKALKELLKWLLFAAKLVIGMLAFILLLGEEAPDANYTLLQWCGIKGGSLLALWLLWRDYLLCGRLNILPDLLMDDWREITESDNREEGVCDE